MTVQAIVGLAIMALILAGVGYIGYRFVQSVRAKRAYEREELPDIFEAEIEDEILPDIEESGFSQIGADFSSDEESASEIYREVYDDGSERRSR